MTDEDSSPVSAAKPTMKGAAPLRWRTIEARMSVVGTRLTLTPSVVSPFFILTPATSSARKSATAAAITTTSQSGMSRMTSWCICEPELTRLKEPPAGGSGSTWAAPTGTEAPRATAVRASSNPCLPLL